MLSNLTLKLLQHQERGDKNSPISLQGSRKSHQPLGQQEGHRTGGRSTQWSEHWLHWEGGGEKGEGERGGERERGRETEERGESEECVCVCEKHLFGWSG